jgi:hypothetical protein
MIQNTVTYKGIKNAVLTISSTPIKLMDAIEAANPGWKGSLGKRFYTLNSFRVYVNSGTLGLRFDGVMATEAASAKVVEEQHFIENCDVPQVSLVGVGGDAEIFVQVGNIS